MGADPPGLSHGNARLRVVVPASAARKVVRALRAAGYDTTT
jgi:hypothetical protein